MKHDMMHFIDEVSEESLQEIIKKMCECAKRAQTAGIDAIQVHGDRLVGALSSTILNHRTDKYGGSLENRTRFAIELVTALRKAVPDMIIDVSGVPMPCGHSPQEECPEEMLRVIMPFLS